MLRMVNGEELANDRKVWRVGGCGEASLKSQKKYIHIYLKNN